MEHDALHTIPEPLRPFLTISEIDDAEFIAGDLFRRKFASSPPPFGRHLVALYGDARNGFRLAGYSHMRPFGDIYLSGGSCSNGDTIRAMDPAHRAGVGSSRVDLQACKLEYSIVSPK